MIQQSLKKSASTLPQDLGLICKTSILLAVNFQEKGLNCSPGPLPTTAPSVLLLCFSQSSEQLPLVWRVGPAQPGGSWASWGASSSETWPQWDLLDLPPLLAPDTPQAGSSPSTPPTSFPPPEAEVTGSPGLGGAVITCQLGKEASSPPTPTPGAVVLAIE